MLEKKLYAAGVETGMASACRYQLRVKFDDGSTVETACRAFGHELASAAVGDVIPVRYDPADRSKIELDRDAITERQKAQDREWDAETLARGEEALGLRPSPAPSASGAAPRASDTGELRIGDADREAIAEVLGRHMTEGRLTTDELDDRLGKLYGSQTRAQARSVLADLPPLAPSGGPQDEAVPVLPDWVSAPEQATPLQPAPAPVDRSSGGIAAPVPTYGEIRTVYRRWQAKAQKVKADKAAHQQAEASGDPSAAALASKRLLISTFEEKSARAKFDQLRKRRPDWTARDD